MKIRNKITLWITAAGLMASLAFSTYVFVELIEQPYELIDAELENQAKAMMAGLQFTDGSVVVISNDMFSSLGKMYWFKVIDTEQRVVIASDLVPLVNLPLSQKDEGYTVKTSILKKLLIPDPDDEEGDDDQDRAAFRVRVFNIVNGGQDYIVQIARPMEHLEEEIRELLTTLIVGMVVFAIVLICIGHVVAGHVVRPVTLINRTAQEINDHTLDRRLPVSQNGDELDMLSSSLNTMFDRLQQSFRLQKEFIANGAHELKTPLTIIRLFFEETQLREDLPEDVKKRFICKNKTVSRMERLVKNLLDLSKLELQQSYNPRLFNGAELIQEVLEDFDTSIELAQIKLNTECAEQLMTQADRDMIRRVLINLIDNAIKYNLEDHGEIRIKAGIDDQDVHILLANTGPGIPEKDLERVFEQFYRVDKSRSTAHGGSGLGLTIVKKIVSLHGGTINILSKEGGWTQVRIILPANQQA